MLRLIASITITSIVMRDDVSYCHFRIKSIEFLSDSLTTQKFTGHTSSMTESL